jgi:hypothetical protein
MEATDVDRSQPEGLPDDAQAHSERLLHLSAPVTSENPRTINNSYTESLASIDLQGYNESSGYAPSSYYTATMGESVYGSDMARQRLHR